MARVGDIETIVSERISVGLSSIVGCTALPFQSRVIMKIVSGNSLEIGGSYSLSAGASAAFTWGKGYLLGTEALTFDSTGIFWMAATGATVVVEVIRQLGPGST